MNQVTINYLKKSAPSIERFRQLHPEEQKWMEPLLNHRTKTALNILDAISNTPLSYQEIADICELHINSVKQVLNALQDGGCRIDMSEKSAVAPTGRPRNLARR